MQNMFKFIYQPPPHEKVNEARGLSFTRIFLFSLLDSDLETIKHFS